MPSAVVEAVPRIRLLTQLRREISNGAVGTMPQPHVCMVGMHTGLHCLHMSTDSLTFVVIAASPELHNGVVVLQEVEEYWEDVAAEAAAVHLVDGFFFAACRRANAVGPCRIRG